MPTTLNSMYVLAPTLQDFFIDKDTGLPLTAGVIKFFKDQAPNEGKDVFQILAGTTQGTYNYVNMGDTLTLSAVGTIVDANGSDIVPYYYPYDTDGNVELYHIEVYNDKKVLQFTRDAWPNISSDNLSADADITNYIPNGQFLAHNSVLASAANDNILGKLTQATTYIAQGGWTFERSQGSTATDILTFPRYNSPVQLPTGNPRFACQIVCTVAGNDTRKDLCIKWMDVNKFGSTDQPYNLYFEGQTGDNGTISNIQVVIRKFFGTGGTPSATQEVFLDNPLTFTAESTKFNVAIDNFGFNGSVVLGTNNDDYVQVCLRFPPSSTFNAVVTNFCLILGDAELAQFPTKTNAAMLDESIPGWMPIPDVSGNDLYLPLILTQQGMSFDHGQIGTVIAKNTLIGFTDNFSTLNNEIIAAGQSFAFTDYSPLGIPMSRLGNLYLQSGNGTPLFGTGYDFVSTSQRGVLPELLIADNYYGSGTNVADTNTGFTMRVIAPQQAQTNVYSNRSNMQNFYIGPIGNGNTLSIQDGPTGKSTGLIFNALRQPTLPVSSYELYDCITSATIPANMAGTYFTFTANQQMYCFWFTYNGTGTQPTLGTDYHYAKINLYDDYNSYDVAYILSFALAGGPISSVTTKSGANVVPNSWFYFTAPNNTTFYVWYNLNGQGVDPKPVGYTKGIPVVYQLTMTDVQVATATETALNSVYFALPDLRGLFLRGWDPEGIWDLEYLSRYSIQNNVWGNQPGTFEYDAFLSHQHTIPDISPSDRVYAAASTGDELVTDTGNFQTNSSGGTETRPANVSVVWAIKY